jgi:hypothetical protein
MATKTTDTNRKSNNRSTAEYGWIVTPRIEDEFKYTPTKYVCLKCNSSKCTPYAYTSELKTLSEIFQEITGTTETVEAQRIRTVAEVGN